MEIHTENEKFFELSDLSLINNLNIGVRGKKTKGVESTKQLAIQDESVRPQFLKF